MPGNTNQIIVKKNWYDDQTIEVLLNLMIDQENFYISHPLAWRSDFPFDRSYICESIREFAMNSMDKGEEGGGFMPVNIDNGHWAFLFCTFKNLPNGDNHVGVVYFDPKGTPPQHIINFEDYSMTLARAINLGFIEFYNSVDKIKTIPTFVCSITKYQVEDNHSCGPISVALMSKLAEAFDNHSLNDMHRLYTVYDVITVLLDEAFDNMYNQIPDEHRSMQAAMLGQDIEKNEADASMLYDIAVIACTIFGYN